jgi:soluble lytic murein transglycosylase-like protein
MLDLTTNASRIALASKYAAKYGLNAAIVAAVCEQESSWNPFAVRFEPAFYERYVVPLMIAETITATEAECRAMSFGLMQVMGQVARERGFSGRFLTELCDPDVGVDIGCRKLQKCFSVHGDADTSLLAYNGGGNVEYASQVLARVAHYEHDAHDAQGAD